jgi:histidinol-phosphatase (PHP family)
MLTSYHNHTAWSDGTATLPEMIESARKSGLDELGISDHFVLAPDSRQLRWAIQTDLLPDYISEICLARAQTEGLVIRLGLEVDYFPETAEEVHRRLAPYPFDYLIGSVHFTDGFPVDEEARKWRELSEAARNGIWRRYWEHLRAAAQTGFFDFIAHFDLPKKFGFFPSIDLTREALSALDAISAAGMAIEINTSGLDKPVAEAYPSLPYLEEANRRKIPLVINADAHTANDLVNHFDRARALAAAAGYTELSRFARRQRFLYAI